MQKTRDVMVSGWQLLVLTSGSRQGGEYRTEVHLIVDNHRVFREALLVVTCASEQQATTAHEKMVDDLTKGAYKLEFGEGVVFLLPVFGEG